MKPDVETPESACPECGRRVTAGQRCNACDYSPGEVVCPALVAHHRGDGVPVAECQACKLMMSDFRSSCLTRC